MAVDGQRWEDRCLSHPPLFPSHSRRGDIRSWETPGEEKHVACCKPINEINQWVVRERGVGKRDDTPVPLLHAPFESRRVSWGQRERRSGSTTRLGPLEEPLAWPEANSAGATLGGTKGPESIKEGPGVRNVTPSPIQDPTQPGVPRPITSLHLSRCPSCHSNHLLPDVSLATGQEWCTFLLLIPDSTLSPASPQDPDCQGSREQERNFCMEQGIPMEEQKRILGQVLTQWASLLAWGVWRCGNTGEKCRIIQLFHL